MLKKRPVKIVQDVGVLFMVLASAIEVARGSTPIPVVHEHTKGGIYGYLRQWGWWSW